MFFFLTAASNIKNIKKNEKFVAMYNKFLKPYGAKNKLILKSYSFGINLILLRGL